MTLTRLKELLLYCPTSGLVSNKKTSRILIPDHDGLVSIFDNTTKKKHKMKLERIAYALAFNELPKDDKRVLHKNLDLLDNKSNNLLLVSRAVFLQIKEAQKNLAFGIRISQHQSDQFTYIIHWFQNSTEKSKMVHDIIEAQKVKLKLQLKYSKILTRYCLFD